MYFKSNANFSKCKMHIKETASKAMFALLSKGRVLQLPVDIMLEMFNKTVLRHYVIMAVRFGALAIMLC